MKKICLLLATIFLFSITSAQYTIDISGLKTSEYNIGEELTFKIILLENSIQTTQQVNYKITDALNKKEITGTIPSDEKTTIKIERDFPSGRWIITTNYSEKEWGFIIKENPEIKFLIEGDELIIRNIGNVRYTKTVHIKIGTKTNSYIQNIKPGDEKILKLISPNGRYDIEIKDDSGDSGTTLKRENVQLFGTGNVVGAIDKELVGYTGFAGTDDPESLKDRPAALNKLPLAMIFIAIVGILIALVIVEKKISGKKNK